MRPPTVLVVGPGPLAERAAQAVELQGAHVVLLRTCTVGSPSTSAICGADIKEGAELVSLSGGPGDFRAGLKVDGGVHELSCGAVVLVPEREGPLASVDPRISTISRPPSDEGMRGARRIALVIGPHASRSSFARALAMARRARAAPHRPEVWVFAREMCAYGLDELLYREAQREGVTFVRTKGEVVLDHGVPLQLRAEDDQSGYNVQVRPDILVLDDEALLPCTTTFTDLMARIDALDGPVSKGAASTMREGVYLALPANGGLLEEEALTRTLTAVTRAVSTALAPPERVALAVVVDRERCSACLTCVRSCPFHAVRAGDEGKATVDARLCQACGVCVGVCPGRALSLPGYSEGVASIAQVKEGMD